MDKAEVTNMWLTFVQQWIEEHGKPETPEQMVEMIMAGYGDELEGA